jgi:tetratricopeptide (TPR) repeat protein
VSAAHRAPRRDAPVGAGGVDRNVSAVVLAVIALSLGTPPVFGQDPCRNASAADAEAGWAAYAENDLTEARIRFETALARCDDDQYARTGLGYVELRDGEAEAAERLWSAVILAEPDNVDALVGLGLARWRAGDVDAVRERFTAVLALSPGHPTAVDYLERVSGTPTDPPPPSDPADQAWASGDTERAARLYGERLQADPDDRTALLRVALARAWREEYRPAIEMLDRLIALDPGHLEARLARARVRAWSGDTSGAQREVLEVLAVQPDNPEALEALALFRAWGGEYEDALESYDALLSIAPDDSGFRRQQAQALARVADFEGARTAYEELLERDPDDLDARLGLARTLAFSQDFEGSIAQYDAVLAREPAAVGALTGKSRTLGWAGRLVASEASALRAVEADRSSADAWGALAAAYRLQGRPAAAKEALETATGLAPGDAEIRDQLRSVNLSLAPVARPTVTYESDSDGNRMITTTLSAGWHPVPRMDVRVEGYFKDLDQGALLRRARGVTLSSGYQFRPGWLVDAGVGGSRSDGTDDPTLVEYRASARTPDRHPIGLTLAHASRGLNETALLAEVGVRSTETLVVVRWVPARSWRVDASAGTGFYDGSERNGRRSASFATSRRLGRFFSLGTSLRGFSFEKDLVDGYFDPDFYGIAELTGYWLYRPADWTFLIELAPGVQQVRSDGPVGGSIRSNARVAYRIGPGRELSLTFGYSSAGLTSFATTAGNYNYTAFILGSSWVF